MARIRLNCVLCLVSLLLPGCGDDPRTGRVRGEVRLAATVCPPPPGDLRGTLVVLASPNRYGPLTETGLQVLPGVDLSRGAVDFEVETPPGNYYLFAFLDENDSFAVWPMVEIGDLWGISGRALTVGAHDQVKLDRVLELSQTNYASAYPLDFAGVCGEEPFTPKERSCLLDFIGNWVTDCYPMLGLRDLDWDGILENHRAELDQVEGDARLFLLLSRMLAGLQDAHVWLDPATSEVVLAEIVGGQPGRLPGFSIARIEGGEVLVTSVTPDSQAEREGLSVGDRIELLGGRTVAEWQDLWRPILPVPNRQYADHLLAQALLVHPRSSPAEVEGQRGDQTAFSVFLEPEDLRTPLEEPPIRQRLLTTPDGRPVGHLILESFAGDAHEFAGRYATAMQASLDSEALIFDLRGNGGGSMTNLHMALSILFDQSMDLVLYWSHHGDPQPVDILALEPLPPVVTLPLFLLVDESCYSTCNLFVQIIQEQGRGTVLGRPTGGGNSSPARVKLSDTLGFHIPAMYLTSASRVDGELPGIFPDIPVPLTREDIQAGGYSARGDPAHDKLLSSALEAIDSGL